MAYNPTADEDPNLYRPKQSKCDFCDEGFDEDDLITIYVKGERKHICEACQEEQLDQEAANQ